MSRDKLKVYQLECIETIEHIFKTNNRQCIQLPTGSGKTWIFSEYLYRNSDRALIVCPSIDLKYQIIDSLNKFNVTDVSENLKNNTKNHVVTIQALSRIQDKNILKKYDHLVIDECHHAQAKSYLETIKYVDKKCKILGLTATPERFDGKSILNIFNTISYSKNIKDMIEKGYLADICAYKIKTGQKIAKRGSSDFRQIELKSLDNQTRNSIIKKTFLENCSDKKTLVFCLNIQHSMQVAHILKEEGIKCEAVHGELPKGKRKELLDDFKKGKIKALTNCQILTEGFDEPSIEALIIARPTASKSLYCQMVGRGLRKHVNKEICYLYELTDNNYNICDFSTTYYEGKERINGIKQTEYPNGIRFSEMKKYLENIPETEIIIKKESHRIILNNKKLAGNTINLLTSKFYGYECTKYQKFCMDLRDIPYKGNENFLEAAFLIWKHDLEEKYGHNTRS